MILGAENEENDEEEIRDSRTDLGLFVGTGCHRRGGFLYEETTVSLCRGDTSTIEEAMPLWLLKQFRYVFSYSNLLIPCIQAYDV